MTVAHLARRPAISLKPVRKIHHFNFVFHTHRYNGNLYDVQAIRDFTYPLLSIGSDAIDWPARHSIFLLRNSVSNTRCNCYDPAVKAAIPLLSIEFVVLERGERPSLGIVGASIDVRILGSCCTSSGRPERIFTHESQRTKRAPAGRIDF